MDLYAENILDHYRNPHNRGGLKNPTVSADEVNPLCGDKIRIELKIENDIIAQAGFTAEGCAISQAAASMLTDEILGKKYESIEKYENEKIYQMLGVPLTPARVKCALLSLFALKKALTLNKIQLNG